MRQGDEDAANNKLQNKDISGGIMFHKQHCHVLSPLAKISRTNEGAFKAVVTALHLMKAFFIHRCQIAVGEAVNDNYSIFRRCRSCN